MEKYFVFLINNDILLKIPKLKNKLFYNLKTYILKKT